VWQKFQIIKTYFQHKSKEVHIGNVTFGGDNPVLVQSMTNTNTLDTNETVKQVIRLAEAGCDIVRITAPGNREAENLLNIKNELLRSGIQIPIVADIHFTPKAAEVAAPLVEKIRINPGNYIDRNRGKADWSQKEIEVARERIAERLYPLIEICKKHNTAIRIGTNHGSLSERILSMYGNTPQGMVESAMEFVHIVRGFDFHDLILSMKASNFRDMVKANLLLVDKMLEEGFYYPVHLGVTEAGNGEEARIKSAAGIGSLLARGIGDTIRVSLAEAPVNEVDFGRKLVENYGRNPQKIVDVFETTSILRINSGKSLKSITGVTHPVVSNETVNGANFQAQNKSLVVIDKTDESPLEYREISFHKAQNSDSERVILKRNYPDLSHSDLLLRATVDFSLLFSEKSSAGIWISCEKRITSQKLVDLSLKILQGLGLRFSKAEFIACPTCGRTKFNLFDSFSKVKEKTAHLKGLQIAVMGCIVNGPGEMGDADYGYVGAGPGKVTLYKKGVAVLKNLDEKNAVDELINLIKKSGDWSESKLPKA